MDLKIAFSNEENMTKLTVIPRLPTPVILKERRHFALCWRMKEKTPRLVVPCGSNSGWLEGKPKKYGANAPHLRPIWHRGTNHMAQTTSAQQIAQTGPETQTQAGPAPPHPHLHPLDIRTSSFPALPSPSPTSPAPTSLSHQ